MLPWDESTTPPKGPRKQDHAQDDRLSGKKDLRLALTARRKAHPDGLVEQPADSTPVVVDATRARSTPINAVEHGPTSLKTGSTPQPWPTRPPEHDLRTHR